MCKKFLVFISILAIAYSSNAQVNVQDSLALIALYNSTDGANWKDKWNLSQPIDTWNGVDVNGGRVIWLFLSSNQLSGSIPGELGKLINLRYLYLSSNQLSGSIPGELGKLINLTELELNTNQLSGNIPRELGKLINLTSLSLDDNQLSGSIPGELGKLINLRYLYLSSNQLSGSIPVEFGKINKLEGMWLNDNQFDELFNLSSLTSLASFPVQNNRLDFGDILPNINVLTDYSPQAPIKEGVRYNTSIGDELILSVQVDGINNVYQWFKDNTVLSSATDDTLKLFDIQTVDCGFYYCEVTNSGAPHLTLRSIPDTVVQKTNSIPTDIALSSTTIEENKAIGTMIGILSTTDPDVGDKHTYNLSGTDAHSFQIIEDTLKSAAVFDYETKSSYIITIQTKDKVGLTNHKNFIISIQRVNSMPTDIVLSSNRIEENKVIGTMIGILSTTDPDANDNHTYNLLGTDANSFQITEDTLKSAAVFDYETKSNYTITIQTTDARGLIFQKDFIISIDKFTALDEWDISNEVTIYPNPSRKNIIIEINNHLIDKGFMEIYSLNGKNEKSFPFEKNRIRQIFILTIPDFPSGMYILHGEIDDYFFTERIFKK